LLKIVDQNSVCTASVPTGPTTQTFIAYCDELSLKLKTGGIKDVQFSLDHLILKPWLIQLTAHFPND